MARRKTLAEVFAAEAEARRYRCGRCSTAIRSRRLRRLIDSGSDARCAKCDREEQR